MPQTKQFRELGCSVCIVKPPGLLRLYYAAVLPIYFRKRARTFRNLRDFSWPVNFHQLSDAHPLSPYFDDLCHY